MPQPGRRVTQTDYRKIPARDWRGQQLLTAGVLANAYGRIPAGTRVTVLDKRQGFRVLTEPCPHCGVQLEFAKCPYQDFEYLDHSQPQPGVETC